jgi:hypothetical protein
MTSFAIHLMHRNKCSALQAELLAAKIFAEQAAKAKREAAQVKMDFDAAPKPAPWEHDQSGVSF